MEPKAKLLDYMRNVMRLKHMSLRTEEVYVSWVKRFILFHDKRHPAEMGADEIRAFLTHLAVQGQVAAATQNGALNALVFLYRQVLKQPFYPTDIYSDSRSLFVQSTGPTQLPTNRHAIVLDPLRHLPVSDLLFLSANTPTQGETF
jgi:hypothetical protein